MLVKMSLSKFEIGPTDVRNLMSESYKKSHELLSYQYIPFSSLRTCTFISPATKHRSKNGKKGRLWNATSTFPPQIFFEKFQGARAPPWRWGERKGSFKFQGHMLEDCCQQSKSLHVMFVQNIVYKTECTQVHLYLHKKVVQNVLCVCINEWYFKIIGHGPKHFIPPHAGWQCLKPFPGVICSLRAKRSYTNPCWSTWLGTCKMYITRSATYLNTNVE